MVHGQAIGIPFRRRKGEQAPPPPKEVAWNPTIESNLPYKEVKYFKFVEGAGWQALNIGEILLVGQRILTQIATVGIEDEVVAAVSEQLDIYGINKNSNGEYNILGITSSTTPQNINITIDEYIRFEDIVQAYPLFFEFTDENGNLISWGGKAKVGSTITRTKGVVYANLLESLYTVTNPRLNGVPLASAEHVVEKQMVFTCTATWKLSNEPNCILSNQILPIPNSSYKYLGYQPDLSGHGNHGVFNNFEFAGMSGANGYLQNFSEWTKASGVSSTDSVISSSNNLVAANGWIAYVTSGTVIPTFKVEISGIPVNGNLRFEGSDQVLVNGVNTIQGLTTTKITGFYISNGYDNDWSNLKIKQIGEYEGAICFNGVNNCMTIPALEHGGKQVLMKVNWQSNVGDAILYDQRGGDAGFAIYNGAVVFGGLAIAYRGRNVGGSTYIDGVLNNHIECSQLRNITHNIIELYDPELGVGTLSPRIGFSNTNINYAQMALFAFMSFPEISPEEEIKDLNDIVGIAGGYVEKPEYYWDCFGKTNDDPDRDAITEQVSKDVANALSVKNADFKLDSGFGKYEVDFLDTSIWNSSNSTITSSKIDCKNAISHIMLLYYNVGDKEYPDIPSFKVIKTGADIDYSYIDETGSPKSVKIVDGVNVLPASHNTLYSGSGRFCGFGNPGIGNSVTITQIPEYQNGFVFNGKTAYLENLNILAITDFTAIAKRVWANKDNPMNECFIHKGVVSTPISESAFMLEYEITNDTYYRSASFGGYINVERVNRPENITYQTTESYNGIPIIKGSGIDTKGLVIGAVTNNYWKGIFYKLMLYSKTIDMLSINALKNLFALDILIDINHPIFKK